MRLPFARAVALVLACVVCTSAAAGAALRFERLGPREFAFNTGELAGKLGGTDYAKGLSSVTHVSSGRRLDSSLGLLSHYRVFTSGKRYGTAAWEWPVDYTLLEDGSVTAKWVGSTARPFDLLVSYRWLNPTTIEVRTTVKARIDLRAFESFLASYFTPDFDHALVCVGTNSGSAPAEGFVHAAQSRGTWQAYPRDVQAAGLINDGRWKLPPNPVDWVIQEPYYRPLAIRHASDSGLTAVIGSNPRDCFAICTPHETESHHSTYLSLFGTDLAAGEEKAAVVRLVLFRKLDVAGVLRGATE